MRAEAQLPDRSGYTYDVNESEYQDLWAIAVQRELNGLEKARLEAWLAAHPDARADWVLDERLTRCLRLLPDIPPSTNFTAQVLHQVERSSDRRRAHDTPAWRRWVGALTYGWRSAAACGVLAMLIAVPYHQARQREALARSLEALPAISLAEVELWRDFDSINSLPAGPVPSVDLLAEAFK